MFICALSLVPFSWEGAVACCHLPWLHWGTELDWNAPSCLAPLTMSDLCCPHYIRPSACGTKFVRAPKMPSGLLCNR